MVYQRQVRADQARRPRNDLSPVSRSIALSVPLPDKGIGRHIPVLLLLRYQEDNRGLDLLLVSCPKKVLCLILAFLPKFKTG